MPGAVGVVVEARGLSKRYGSGPGAVMALADASLTIGQGEFVSVMGPSGSGKSTLMNLLGLLDLPTGGTLRLLGEDVAPVSTDARARLRNRHIGFVFQSYHLIARRTALANVELPLLYRGVPRRERRRRAEAVLDRIGLSHRAGAYPVEMSGGEQQRTVIARALVGDPELVIADEPTGALDSRSGAQVLDLLGEICAEGRAVVVVTHDPTVAGHGSRIVNISDGRIVRDRPVRPQRIGLAG